jgi:diguanylate cyclase (GGDEF)-like protein
MEMRRLAALYAGLMIAASAVHLWWRPGASYGAAVVGVGSVAAVLYGVRRYRPVHATPWLLLAAALLLNITARLLYVALPGALGSLKPWIWVVWLLQLVMMVALTAGLLTLVRSTLRGASAAIDSAIIVLGTGLLGAVLIAIPYASTPGGNDLWSTVRVAYVARDVLILAAGIHIATAVRLTRSVVWMLAGLLGLLVYDVLFRVGRIHGEWLGGTAIDIGWLLFFAAVGAAALTPSMRTFDTPVARHSRDGSPIRIGLVVTLALMPSVVLLIGLFRDPPWYQPLIVIAATLILILALARIVDVAARLRRQMYGERVLRQAVPDLASAREVAAIVPTLRRAVGRLLPPGTDYQVALALPRTTTVSDVVSDSIEEGLHRTTELPPAVASQLGDRGLTLATSAVPARYPSSPALHLIEDRVDRMHRYVSATENGSGPTLLVRSDRRSLDELKPRLEVLATQAGFALERIRLDQENIRHISESYFRALVQNSTDVILIVDDDNRIRYASPSAGAVFGDRSLRRAWLPGLVQHPDRRAVEALLDEVRAGPGRASTSRAADAVRHEDWIIQADGIGPARVEVASRDLRDESSIGGLVLTLHNVTRQRLLEHELEQRAFHDPLTGLGNRLPFSERIDAAVARSEAGAGLTAVLYADIDDLKAVNDRFGHDKGDAVLIAVGHRLRAFVDRSGGPERCMAARLGGDEFAVLLAGIPDARSADLCAAELLRTLSLPIDIGGHEVAGGASVGVATTEDDAGTSAELIRNADLALYAAKAAGKGHWRHFEPWMRSTVMARLEVRSSLERAIADDALRLEYQPIVALDDGHPIGFEALLRWQHPTRGRLKPDEFIDIAEESGLIAPIGEWVLATALRTARTWARDDTGTQPYVGVNVSARQFRTPGFTSTFHRILAEGGLRPDRVMLEITESLLLRDDDTVWQDLQDLRRSGVRIAIDDFGTGYSALSYLRHVPLDVIKLDRSFIQSMAVSVQQRELVQGIVGLADTLGLQVIAEGIETENERLIAEQIGCSYGQGYLFSPPMPVDETHRFLIGPRRELALGESHSIVT